MTDYEQLYYDAQYKIKQLEKQNKLLEHEIDIYKSFQANKDLKKVIVDMLIKYIKKEGNNERFYNREINRIINKNRYRR